MRLGLFRRLGRFFGLRHAPQGGGGGQRGPRSGGSEGKHRRNTGSVPARDWPAGGVPGAQPNGMTATLGMTAQQVGEPRPVQSPPWAPMRPPARMPAAGGGTGGGPALPPMPRNYAPGTGVTNGTGGQRVIGDGARNGARNGAPSGAGGVGRARIREAPAEATREAPLGTAPAETVTRAAQPMEETHGEPRQPWYQVVGGSPPPPRALSRPGQARAGARAATAATAAQLAAAQAAAQTDAPGHPAALEGNGTGQASLPYTSPRPSGHLVRGDGRRHCGPLEKVLWRQWDAATTPPPEVVAAIDRLAEFPRQLQEKLAAGLDGIYVGTGGVPDLDHMAALHGVALPAGRATWDACAGAYGDRKIVVGTRPSPTPDVMCHEVGHALDDLDSPPGKWQSDSAEFRLIYDQCQPSIASDFHRQRGGLGRKEFFADSFAAIASAQRPALVEMLSGNTRIALRVMLYFNRRYGI